MKGKPKSKVEAREFFFSLVGRIKIYQRKQDAIIPGHWIRACYSVGLSWFFWISLWSEKPNAGAKKPIASGKTVI